MPTLDLIKRTELADAFNMTQFDANLTAIEIAVNAKAELTDPRFTDARTPVTHQHTLTDLPAVVTALAGKASQSALDSLATTVAGYVATNDARLSNARAIADGNYTLFTVASGVATLASSIVTAAKMANGSHGLFTYASNVATVNTKTIGPTALTDSDFGAFTVLNGVATLDNGSVAAAKLVDASFGLFTMAAGVASINTKKVGPTALTDSDFGAFTVLNGVATLDSGVVVPLALANQSFGLFTVASGVASINDGTSVADVVAGTAAKPITSAAMKSTWAPRIVTPVSGAVTWDAADGLCVVIPEGANNLQHDNAPWTNLPLDKDADVWVYAGASARTNTWSDPGSNLILPVDNDAPYNGTNRWKHFIYRWVCDPVTPSATTKYRRVVIFGGYFS
jgi:hypothetical protein